MKSLPGEKNWLNDVLQSAAMYSIEIDEDKLKSITKDTFKVQVKAAIEKYAFEQLKRECASQSKTKTLMYEEFKCQPYLRHLYPSQSKTILKCRARCLSIKSHRPFMFSNKICRWCNMEEENVSHILNCGWTESMEIVDVDTVGTVDKCMESKLISLAARINEFLDRVVF